MAIPILDTNDVSTNHKVHRDTGASTRTQGKGSPLFSYWTFGGHCANAVFRRYYPRSGSRYCIVVFDAIYAHPAPASHCTFLRSKKTSPVYRDRNKTHPRAGPGNRQYDRKKGELAQIAKNKRCYIAKSSTVRWLDWGVRITVLFKHDLVLLNSICDPEMDNQITSFGQNRRNVEVLVSALKSREFGLAPKKKLKLSQSSTARM